MPDNLVIKSLGNVQLSSGDGLPDHVAPKGTVYTDTLTGDSFVNTTGLINGWEPILKKRYSFFSLTNNTTSTLTATNSWTQITSSGNLIGSDVFTYSPSNITIISSTGDGGFANTITTGTQGFYDNGWVVVNGTSTNKWFVGTTGASGGSGFGAYVSSNNGGNNAYVTQATTTAVYFYKDVILPAYTSNYSISFSIRVGGEGNNGGTLYDYVRVYSAPTSQTFSSGTLVATNNLLDVNSNNPTIVATSSFPTRSTSFTITPTSTTQSKRIAFCWTNDSISISNPPAPSIDNISVTTPSPISITYTGSQSTFRVLMTGSFQSSVSGSAINNASLLIAKNNATSSSISESTYDLLTTNRKDGFNVQNIFTMSNGDTISPFINNKSSNVAIIVNDLKIAIWEV